jgi:uncharacterized RDD family membrane protein YckC
VGIMLPHGMQEPPRTPNVSREDIRPGDSGSWDSPLTGPAPGWTFGGLGRRLVAQVIDGCLLALVAVAVATVSVGIAVAGMLVGFPTYYVVMWVTRSQTLGMIPFGLRVVRDVDGGPLTWGNGILRLIGWLIASSVFYIGFIWAVYDARQRGWHDILGGTIVVRKTD